MHDLHNLSKKERELANYKYSELVDFLTWEAIQSLVRGNPLRTVIGEAVRMTMLWKTEKDLEKAHGEKENK